MDVCRLSRLARLRPVQIRPIRRTFDLTSELWRQCSWPGAPLHGTPSPVAGVIDFPFGGQGPLAGVDLPVFLILPACYVAASPFWEGADRNDVEKIQVLLLPVAFRMAC
jgi:hypothetical protein